MVPWYSFSSITMPYTRHRASAPAVSIGKFYEQQDRTMIPLVIHSNHALIDGYHVSRFLDCLTSYLSDPEIHMSLEV